MSFGLDEFFVESSLKVELPSGDIEHAVMETFGDFGEFAVDEFAVLVDGIAGEDDGAIFAEVFIEEVEEFLFDGLNWLTSLVLFD